MVTPATSAVSSRDGCDTEVRADASAPVPMTRGFQHHDVAHGEERGEAAADSAGDGGRVQILKVAVKCAGGALPPSGVQTCEDPLMLFSVCTVAPPVSRVKSSRVNFMG